MATPPLGVPGFAETHSAIDAAVAAVLDDDTNGRNVDIVGAAVSMAAITMDRVEVMLNRLRGRGRRMKNPHLLTLARPYARAPPSPAPKTAIPLHQTPQAASPEPRTAMARSPLTGAVVTPPRRPGMGFGPVVTPPPNRHQSPAPSLYDAKTIGRGVISSPFRTPPSQRDTVRELNNLPSPGQLSSGYPTAMEPATPPQPASRRQSISNLRLPSTRTGLEVTPARSPAFRTGRDAGFGTARTPQDASTKTAREKSYRQVPPVSPGTGRAPLHRPGSACLPMTPPKDLYGNPQYVSGQGPVVTPPPRPGFGFGPVVTPPADLRQPVTSPRDDKTIGRGIISSPFRTPPSQRETYRENTGLPSLSPCQQSSGYPTAMEPATPPQPASRRQSISNLRLPSTRTGLEVTPSRSPAVKTGRDAHAPLSTRTGREITPARSPGHPYLAAADSSGKAAPKSSSHLVSAREPSLRTGISPASREPSLRTGRSPAPREPSLRTGRARSPYTPPVSPMEGSTRTAHEKLPPVSPLPAREQSLEVGRAPSQHSGLLPPQSPLRRGPVVTPARSDIELATPPEPASRRQSISNLRVPSTRTGLEVTPSRSPAVRTGRDAPLSTRTGREITPARSPAVKTGRDGYARDNTACEPTNRSIRMESPHHSISENPTRHTQRSPNCDSHNSNIVTAKPALTPVPSFKDSTRTGREETLQSSGYPTAMEPATPPEPASRRQSISNLRVPSTRTGLEITPSRSPALRTGRDTPTRTGRDLQSSGYPTAMEPVTPPSPASRRQSISNLRIPSTRTGLEITPSRSPALRTGRDAPLSTRTGLEVTPSRSPAIRTGRDAKSPGFGTARTPQGVSPYKTALSAASPLPPASRRQSISNLRLPSTRTGLEVTPRSSGYPTAISPGNSQHSTAFSTAQSMPSGSLGNMSLSELFPPLDPESIRPRNDLGHQPNQGAITPPKSPYVFARSPMSASMVGSRPGADTLAPPSTRTAVSPSPSQLALFGTSRPGDTHAPISGVPFVPPSGPAENDEGLDRVTIESCDSTESVHSQQSVEINNAEPQSSGGKRKRRMHPSRILLNGEEVWRKAGKK